MANGCYALGTSGHFTFKPTDLGTYLLYSDGGKFLAGSNGAGLDAGPSAGRRVDGPQGRQALHVHPPQRSRPRSQRQEPLDRQQADEVRPRNGQRAAAPTPSRRSTSPATRTPGVTSYQEVRGYVDAHTHGMAFEFLGGDVHCGRPWHKYGAPYALARLPGP